MTAVASTVDASEGRAVSDDSGAGLEAAVAVGVASAGVERRVDVLTLTE